MHGTQRKQKAPQSVTGTVPPRHVLGCSRLITGHKRCAATLRQQTMQASSEGEEEEMRRWMQQNKVGS